MAPFDSCDTLPSEVENFVSPLPTFSELPQDDDDDYISDIELDLLHISQSFLVIPTSKIVFPYSCFKHPMGYICSVYASRVTLDISTTFPSDFSIIIDSRCTKHMFSNKQAFISYQEAPNAYIILANKTLSFLHGDRSGFIILNQVLHVPILQSPLISVRYWASFNIFMIAPFIDLESLNPKACKVLPLAIVENQMGCYSIVLTTRNFIRHLIISYMKVRTLPTPSIYHMMAVFLLVYITIIIPIPPLSLSPKVPLFPFLCLWCKP
jgi:hypothetical protein